jgi:hypothetical protein
VVKGCLKNRIDSLPFIIYTYIRTGKWSARDKNWSSISNVMEPASKWELHHKGPNPTTYTQYTARLGTLWPNDPHMMTDDNEEFIESLKHDRGGVRLVAVNEPHCISKISSDSRILSKNYVG